MALDLDCLGVAMGFMELRALLDFAVVGQQERRLARQVLARSLGRPERNPDVADAAARAHALRELPSLSPARIPAPVAAWLAALLEDEARCPGVVPALRDEAVWKRFLSGGHLAEGLGARDQLLQAATHGWGVRESCELVEELSLAAQYEALRPQAAPRAAEALQQQLTLFVGGKCSPPGPTARPRSPWSAADAGRFLARYVVGWDPRHQSALATGVVKSLPGVQAAWEEGFWGGFGP